MVGAEREECSAECRQQDQRKELKASESGEDCDVVRVSSRIFAYRVSGQKLTLWSGNGRVQSLKIIAIYFNLDKICFKCF